MQILNPWLETQFFDCFGCLYTNHGQQIIHYFIFDLFFIENNAVLHLLYVTFIHQFLFKKTVLLLFGVMFKYEEL